MLVAVHAGAGFHSQNRAKESIRACKQACKEAVKSFEQTENILNATASAVVALEERSMINAFPHLMNLTTQNDPCTNAGFGSNLSLNGSVSCDSSIVLGTGASGAVGNIQGIKNPILVAKALAIEEMKGSLSLGRVPPIFLVGEGARDWAIEHNIPYFHPEKLITDESHQAYSTHKALVERKAEKDAHSSSCLYDRLDTVGAVCVDSSGNVCAATSSGGVLLKSPGRVGQAGVLGCGCWADACPEEDISVACTTSGVGEHLIKTMLATRLCEAIKHTATASVVEATSKCFQTHYQNCEKFFSLNEPSSKQAGFLGLQYSAAAGVGEVFWAHSTHSIPIGYMSSRDARPNAFISFMEKDRTSQVSSEDCRLNISGYCFRLK
ncbi:threonine aspartase 1-like isoform X2 [Oscarella lobularis]|uniref:threonine aspartase 1-like isoform X2 n=1 Tax=Oscarella lobularis TaxID=121494 RepID=UPI003313D51D